jgi:hypothetical protein
VKLVFQFGLCQKPDWLGCIIRSLAWFFCFN